MASGIAPSKPQLIACFATLIAPLASRAPIACATMIDAPIVTALRIESRKKRTCRAVPTPAVAVAPRRATRIVSTTPTIVSSKFCAMIGQASPITRIYIAARASGGSVARSTTGSVRSSVNSILTPPPLRICSGSRAHAACRP